MDRIVVVAAVLPVFGLLLFLVSAPLARRGGALTPSRVAPPLYVAVLAAAVAVAVVQTGGQPADLGITPPALAGLPLALAALVMVLAGLVGALVAYFGELWLVSRGRRRSRAGAAPGGGTAADGSSAIQAVRSWLPNPVAFLAVGVLTAVLEEVLWRGFLLQGLRAHLWLGLALLAQAVLFGLTHLPFGLRHVFAKAVSGLLWGLLVVAFSTVLIGIVAHLGFQVLSARRLWRQAAAQRATGERGEQRAVHHAEAV